jgi:hypothetical protein
MELTAASIPEQALRTRKEWATVSRWALRRVLRGPGMEQVRHRKRYPCPDDACFARRDVRGDAAFFDLAQRPGPRRLCFRSSRHPRPECGGLPGGLSQAVALQYPVRCPVRHLIRHLDRLQMQVEFRTNHGRDSKFPRLKHRGRLPWSGSFRRSRAREHEGGPMQPGLWSSIGTVEIAPLLPYTNARLRHARRLSPASAPIRMRPWRRGSVRRVRPALQLRPYLLSPCGCVPEFAASLPLPSIVAASRPGNQNLNGVLH